MLPGAWIRNWSKRLLNRAGELAAQPYKFFLGYSLALGLRAFNRFDFPSNQWPPPTPARRYIDEFLTAYEAEIRGRCVEFAPPVYMEKFGGQLAVTSYDVWDVSPGVGTTVVGDLQRAPHLPDACFDTIICTHVLCCIENPWMAVKEMYRLLSPGGVVLCTNPVVLQKYAPHPKDYWRFSRDSMETLFSSFRQVMVHSFGNAATVSGSPFYLMTYHFPKSVVDEHDEFCPSVVAVAAWK
jgi:hypothetical protein